jgi:hypothetical protein
MLVSSSKCRNMSQHEQNTLVTNMQERRAASIQGEMSLPNEYWQGWEVGKAGLSDSVYRGK